MSSRNEIYVILMVKFVNDVTSEKISGSSWAHTPPTGIIGIAPHQIAHGTVMSYFLLAVKATNLIQGVNRG